MDEDTIFPSLSYGETIVGKYRYSERRLRVETICIVTNFRLLVRWRETFCLCLHQSSYSSIALNSISRIDETRPNRYQLVTYALLLLIGLGALIAGFATDRWFVWAPGIGALAITLILLFVYCLTLKKKFLTLKGTFGSISFKFDKPVAREFEAKLNEMVYMSQATHVNTQANPQGQPWSPTAPYVDPHNQAVYYSKLRNETLNNF